MIVVVWQSWWTLAAIAFALISGVLAQIERRRYKRKLKALGNAVYRLPMPAPGQPKVTIRMEGEEPVTGYWERVDL